jgi:hypothetical protein
LDKGLERGIEVENGGLTIAEKLFLDGKPRLIDGAAALTDDILELNG